MFFRILQQERLHPVPAPVGLHHLKHVADGGGAGDPGAGGVDQPGQPGLQTLLARQTRQQHDVGLRIQSVHCHSHGAG